MASMIMRPEVVSFLDIATRSSDLKLRPEETTISSKSEVAGKTLQEARIPQRGLIVITLRKKVDEHREIIFNPVAETRQDDGDEVIVLGKDAQITQLRRYVAR